MRRAIVFTALVSLLAIAATAVAASAFDGAKSATARFHDLEQANDAGYTVRVADAAGIECIAQPGEGAMGIHMLSPALLNATVEADRPEVLVYEQRNNGTLKLVALEYLVFEADWAGSSPPSLFGRQFDYVPAGNRYGLPAFYALHAWLWKPNPSGILHAWNPNVECEGS
jgi:hypothetical protein